MSTDDVYVFEIAAEDFDSGLLPESARHVGSPEFKDQVRSFFEWNLEAFAGWHDISVEDDKIRVSWKASADKADAHPEIMKKLRDGDHHEGIQLLRLLLTSREKDSAVHYNLGMALSDTGDLDEAEEHLRKAIEIDPTFTNAKVALGVALSRKRQWEQAASVLEEAVEEEPANPYALRNLAACLLALERNPVGRAEYLRKATAILRKATAIPPEDQYSWMNLGQALELQNEVVEANAAYRKAIEINPGNPIAESARRTLTRIAKNSFNEAGIGVVRRDAVAYCVSAIENFSKMSDLEIRVCAFEIGRLGMTGIKVNCRDKSYTLKSMKRPFSALELVCYQFVGFKRTGRGEWQKWFDLSKEYKAALRISKRR